MKIAALARGDFPRIETFTRSASINDLFNKRDADLGALREAGYNDLHIGLEAGWGPAVARMRKGFAIAAVATAVSPGSALARMRDAGEYVELTEGEMLDEELILLKSLEMEDDCLFFGSHPYNTIPVSGLFSDRHRMIAYLEAKRKQPPPAFLNSAMPRGQL